MDAKRIEDLISKEGAETRRHFDIVAEGIRSDVQRVAEGVVGTSERMDRHEDAMRSEFAEVRAMIKLSFTELDR